jgi:hypothetical protein
VATYQSTLVVGAPTTVAANCFVLAVPAGSVQEVGETVTTGGGVMVTEELAVTIVSSKEVAETVTVAGDGSFAGA